MAYVAMAYVVMAYHSNGLCSYGYVVMAYAVMVYVSGCNEQGLTHVCTHDCACTLVWHTIEVSYEPVPQTDHGRVFVDVYVDVCVDMSVGMYVDIYEM